MKIFLRIALILSASFALIFYGLILPEEERKYNEAFNEQTSEKTNTTEEDQNKKNNEDQADLIKGKPLSSFSKFITQDEMEALVGALSKIDSTNERNLQRIASIFLESMGYPGDLIIVEYHSDNTAKFEGDLQAGAFIPSSGRLTVNSKYAQYGDIRTIIGVMRHELDHFDKFAKLCKSIGVNNFDKMYGGNINRDFWERAIEYADISGFDKNRYLKAASAINEYTDITSFYQVFVEKSNDVRNPFELTAYAFTDYVNAHYKIRNNQETLVKQVAKTFNQVDWQIYKIANNNKYLSRSRSAIFDYYFLRAMITYNPNLKTAYQEAVKNSKITGFWEECEKLAEGLKTNVLTSEDANKIINILNSMNLAMNEQITNKQVNSILQLKYITLKDAARNPKYSHYMGNLAILLGINVTDYLKFLDAYSTDDDSMKLKLLTTKYWLSNIIVEKESGGEYKFTDNESIGSIEKKIKSTKAYKAAQKASGMDNTRFFEDYIEKNKIFP